MTSTSHPLNTRSHPLRSGTAARLAGLPVTTLRVWERRYGVVAAAPRTSSGQRIYSLADVARLRLLRQLTGQGHAIGSIATLALESLQVLAGALTGEKRPVAAAPLETVVVGRGAARALKSIDGCVLRAVYDDLDQASAGIGAGQLAAGLLLARLASLQPPDVERLLALAAAMPAGAVLVVYAFGLEASAEALRRAGVQVRREPLASQDLAQWVEAARGAAMPASAADVDRGVGVGVGDGGQAANIDAPVWQIAPRRFSDDALAQLAEAPSPVSCECLRHLTEIVGQLTSFERYSQECRSTGPADVALHRHLGRTAGAARTLFEQALQRVLAGNQGRAPSSG